MTTATEEISLPGATAAALKIEAGRKMMRERFEALLKRPPPTKEKMRAQMKESAEWGWKYMEERKRSERTSMVQKFRNNKMRRVKTKVCDAEARKRLEEYRMTHGVGPHRAATLADVIWTDAKWIAEQGAGAAASRVLKRLGCYWTERNGNWGWMLSFPKESSPATGRATTTARKI